MRVIKIAVGVLAGLYVLALVPKLIVGLLSVGGGRLAVNRLVGTIAGMLLGTAISLFMFKSGFTKRNKQPA